MKPGDKVTYYYKGPHGFSIRPTPMPAEVLSTTKKGMIKIRAFDAFVGKHFESTVWPRSLTLDSSESQQGGNDNG